MASNREAIMARLEALAATVPGVVSVQRNQPRVNDTRMPAIHVMEGDENALDSTFGRGRPARGPNIIYAQPHIILHVQDNSAVVGTTLNEMREAIIDAVQNDSTLLTLAHNGDIRYEGMQSDLGAGRALAGAFALIFTIAFVQH